MFLERPNTAGRASHFIGPVYRSQHSGRCRGCHIGHSHKRQRARPVLSLFGRVVPGGQVPPVGLYKSTVCRPLSDRPWSNRWAERRLPTGEGGEVMSGQPCGRSAAPRARLRPLRPPKGGVFARSGPEMGVAPPLTVPRPAASLPTKGPARAVAAAQGAGRNSQRPAGTAAKDPPPASIPSAPLSSRPSLRGGGRIWGGYAPLRGRADSAPLARAPCRIRPERAGDGLDTAPPAPRAGPG